MEKQNKVKNEKEIVEELKRDFEARKAERKPFETAWQLNMNFLMGNQYCGINQRGDIADFYKQYFWQEREVFNHIAPLIETRLSKLTRVRPSLTVQPASGDLDDINTAKVSKGVLDATCSKLGLNNIISEATKWSEICGTVFYKILWNKEKGALIGKTEKYEIKEGDAEVVVCSPFEIYPDSNSASKIEDCRSIIHARSYHTDTIKNIWGVEVQGGTLEAYTLDNTQSLGGLGYSSASGKIAKTVKHNQAIVLERYELPSKEHKNGRLTITAGDKLIYDGELPYINSADGARTFPFVRQLALENPNLFWGTSIIERCIPVQRAYNAVKNRKHEFLNRISMGVLTVEDGSVDVENLEEEGLCPGKVLVYRQGSGVPKMLNSEHVPMDFTYEEERLLNEFSRISGVNDLLGNLATSFSNLSGVALQVLVEQEDARISASGESIRFAALRIAEHILRLYKQFATTKRIAKIVGTNGEVEQFYWDKSAIDTSNICFETEMEFGETVAQKRSMVFELLKAGLLHDENGKLSNTMRLKALELLGFGVWENALDIKELQRKSADFENMELLNNETVPKILEVHDHVIHEDLHTAFMLNKEFREKCTQNPELGEVMLSHIREHRRFSAIEKELKIEQK